MTSLVSQIMPSATNMLRLDHTHVMSTFHQFKVDAPTRVKKGLVNTICTSLEIHAQLEEEIFYPAVREICGERIQQSLHEHDEMKRLIKLLRQMEPEAIDYDETVMALMRDVIHHVADEETIVFPAAEQKMRDQLGELGTQLTKRRLQLVAPRTGEIALDMGRAVSGNTAALAFAAAAALSVLAIGRARARSKSAHPHL
jgi:hemerythrin superfamily protein